MFQIMILSMRKRRKKRTGLKKPHSKSTYMCMYNDVEFIKVT